jgi:uncharacterized membrane protein
MKLLFDIPWPWSLSPVEALRGLTGNVLPSWLGRVVVACLSAVMAIPVWGRKGALPVVFAVVLGVVGWLLAQVPMPALCAVFLVFLTVATYRSKLSTQGVRILVLLVLRLAALVMAILTLIRPALAVREDQRVPSVLLVGLDFSASMTIKDEYNDQTRFQAMQKTLAQCESLLKELRDEQQITVHIMGFAGDAGEYDPSALPTGMRSDYGQLLNRMHERFANEANFRGFIIVGDGADNGTRINALAEAAKFRALQCPIYTFVTGDKTTATLRKDLIAARIQVEPTPVYIKGKMTIRVSVDALGLENARITPTLEFDGKEAKIERIFMGDKEVTEGHPRVELTTGNDLRLVTTAPATPSEILVKVKLAALPGEVTTANNEIATYVSVVKDGVSVLLVDDDRQEKKYIRQALAGDPRFRLFEVTRQTEEAPPPNIAELFQFDKQAYDVIILGNVSAKRLAACGPKTLDKIAELVREKGVGLMMIGGEDSFGGTPGRPRSGDWGTEGKPIADLLPVDVSEVNGHIPNVEFHPTLKGQQHFLLQLGSSPQETLGIWRKVNEKVKLAGMNRLGKPGAANPVKTGAEILATTSGGDQGEPILVASSVGKGRVLAFGADTTWYWINFGLPESTDGINYHARFWKQTVLWLAHQENAEGNVWVKPDFRRLASGSRQAFTVGIRGKTGMDLPGGSYTVKVTAPDGTTHTAPINRERTLDRGIFWRTELPGEYKLEVTGKTIDVDQQPVSGSASIRFLVYQDESELQRQSADHDFMGKLAAAGGGPAQPSHIADLPEFLKKLKAASLPNQRIKLQHYPDWRKKSESPRYIPPLFLPIWLSIFVAVLAIEWGLRRWWGMV